MVAWHTDCKLRCAATMTISLAQATSVWIKIGLTSFGGPAGQIALMHQELVDKHRWISEERFLNALNFCMLLPGPEAQQLSVYLGWLMHKKAGGLIAGLLFILPGFLFILAMSLIYVTWGSTFFIAAVFFGLKAAVLAIVIHAIWRIANKTLKNYFMVGIAVSSFIAVYFLDIAFPLIIIAAAAAGVVGQRIWPEFFIAAPQASQMNQVRYSIDDQLETRNILHARPSVWRSIMTAIVWLAIWAAPVILVFAVFGADSILGKQAVFFSNTAVFSFGGAYAVLAYVAQRLVDEYQWISPREMVDGLALAETTPGPLILVLQFVAFMAAYHHQTGLSPIAAGILASFITVWVTFAPCFLWIFVGAPYIETLRSNLRLQAALKAITAAVVGVIANLSLWFAVNTLFADSERVRWYVFEADIPLWESIQWPMLLIMSLALAAILKFGMGIIKTMLLSCLLGLAAYAFIY